MSKLNRVLGGSIYRKLPAILLGFAIYYLILTISEGGAHRKSASSITQKDNSVYERYAYRVLSKETFVATAVPIASNYALTNAHVCQSRITQVSSRDFTQRHDILRKISSKIRGRDICLLIVKQKFSHLANISADKRNTLKLITMAGYPSGAYKILEGEIVLTNEAGDRYTGFNPMQMTSVIISPGASGSPVFDSKGNIVGLITSFFYTIQGARQGRGVIAPISEIHSFLAESHIVTQFHKDKVVLQFK